MTRYQHEHLKDLLHGKPVEHTLALAMIAGLELLAQCNDQHPIVKAYGTLARDVAKSTTKPIGDNLTF